jgi:acetate CoA/acetoacetate CoA-transferase beta subunit
VNTVDADKLPASIRKGGSTFSTHLSFDMIRGGHIDLSILGGLQVSRNGDLADWALQSRTLNGMGGAMDLAENSKSVIVVMEHCAKDGSSKLVNKCTHPLTAKQVVTKLITELGVFEFRDSRMTLTEIAEETTLEEVRHKSDCDFDVAPKLLAF